MTEELARTKWCPMARALATKHKDGELVDCMGGYNKVSLPEGVELPDSSLCITSDCMMWRSTTEKESYREGKEVQSSGYCGLAGKL